MDLMKRDTSEMPFSNKAFIPTCGICFPGKRMALC